MSESKEQTNALVRESKEEILKELAKTRGSSGGTTYSADVKVNSGQINQVSGSYATINYGLTGVCVVRKDCLGFYL